MGRVTARSKQAEECACKSSNFWRLGALRFIATARASFAFPPHLAPAAAPTAPSLIFVPDKNRNILNSLTTLIISTAYQQFKTDKQLMPEDAYVGLCAYRDYFAAEIAEKESPDTDISPATDRFIEALEDQLIERVNLDLDSMVLGKQFPTFSHLCLDAFQEVIDAADAFPLKVHGYFMVYVDEIGPTIDDYDRRWLRDTHGIRATPNFVRTISEAFSASLDQMDGASEEAFHQLLLQINTEHPDDPLFAAQLVLRAPNDEVADYARRFLRPLLDYPAGQSGFYHDDEVIDNWAAHFRYLIDADQNEAALPYAENLLRLGYDGPMIGPLEQGLVNAGLKVTAAHRKKYPLITARLAALPGGSTMDAMQALMKMMRGGGVPLDQDDFFGALGQAMGTGGAPSRGRGAKARKLPSRPLSGSILRLKISLKGSKPLIWRRVEVRADTPLGELHAIIQTVFEWENSHLHAFQNSRRDSFVSPDDPYSLDWSDSYEGMTIADMFSISGKKFTYHYDFGDSWYHAVTLEKELPADKKARYPRCTAGRCAAPLDDMGGLWGYYDFVEALQDPKHDMHEDALDYLGKGFDPKAFEVGEIDERLVGFR